ncbi:MAG: radical SAM protein, partial [Anaerolineaceae bacterium]|nr:radical SAM protein [Anaerolineaceae bacterium]
IDTKTIQELTRLAEISLDFYKNDVSNYHSVYKPVGILPPDQYISVVLQLTEGCSFNKCTFCSFYRDRPFLIKSPVDFDQHITNVKNFLGNGLSLRRTIFLGDANALVVPVKKLIPLMEKIHDHLDVEKLGGIFAFLDGFSGERKSTGDYKKLRDLGMNKIYIGLESGNNQLLKFLNKPGSAQDALNAVRTIKSSGISVGIIVLLGAGGKQYDVNHTTDTIEIINQMSLDADDLVYFSELIESEGLEYSQNAFSENLLPLSDAERQAQRKRIEEQLLFSDSGTPHISTYDIRDFVY